MMKSVLIAAALPAVMAAPCQLNGLNPANGQPAVLVDAGDQDPTCCAASLTLLTYGAVNTLGMGAALTSCAATPLGGCVAAAGESHAVAGRVTAAGDIGKLPTALAMQQAIGAGCTNNRACGDAFIAGVSNSTAGVLQASAGAAFGPTLDSTCRNTPNPMPCDLLPGKVNFGPQAPMCCEAAITRVVRALAAMGMNTPAMLNAQGVQKCHAHGALGGCESAGPLAGLLPTEAAATAAQADICGVQANVTEACGASLLAGMQVGGNISTNAGGLRLLRYGNLHGSVLGIEFVRADGRVVDVMSLNKKVKLIFLFRAVDVMSLNKKDNTGIDLKQLLIGSEGILGVVTKVGIACPPAPRAQNVLLAALDSYEDCVRLFQAARRDLGEILSAFEFFDGRCAQVTKENLSWQHPEFVNVSGGGRGDGEDEVDRFNVLIETSGSRAEHDEEKLHAFLEKMAGVCRDGAVAQSSKEMGLFWQSRERIAEALNHDGYVYKYDVSLPDISKLYDLVLETRERCAAHSSALRVVGYGHMGDGNLHLNITSKSYESSLHDVIEPWLWERVSDLRGSISAEHGLGAAKAGAIAFSKKPEAVELMRELKRVMDPNGILNPYKVVLMPRVDGAVAVSGAGEMGVLSSSPQFHPNEWTTATTTTTPSAATPLRRRVAAATATPEFPPLITTLAVVEEGSVPVEVRGRKRERARWRLPDGWRNRHVDAVRG
eukprot:gene304-309_t